MGHHLANRMNPTLQTVGSPPEALSRDLIARALAYWLQEERLGGLDTHVRTLLASLTKKGAQRVRHLKVRSVIVREVHEVLAPAGFCWQGQIYSRGAGFCSRSAR
jgi:hypothetical protein